MGGGPPPLGTAWVVGPLPQVRLGNVWVVGPLPQVRLARRTPRASNDPTSSIPYNAPETVSDSLKLSGGACPQTPLVYTGLRPPLFFINTHFALDQFLNEGLHGPA